MMATGFACVVLLLEGCAVPEASTVNAEATVVGFVPQAMHEDYSDGRWAAFDAVELMITAPQEWQGTQLVIYFTAGYTDTLLQTGGTRCAFTIDREYIAGQSVDAETGRITSHTLFEGALVDLRIIDRQVEPGAEADDR